MFKKGVSGNPRGKPKGRTLSSKLRQAVDANFDEILQVVIDLAKSGDPQALSLVFSRTCPPIKAVQEPIKIGLTGDTLTAKAEGILDAVSNGNLSVNDGKELLNSLAAVSKIVEIDDLTKRIQALEANK